MGFAIGANQANSQWVDIGQSVTTRNLVNFESASIVGNAAGVGTANLTPFFSVSFDDSVYWSRIPTSVYTQGTDGWAVYYRNHTGGAVYTYARTNPFAWVDASKEYVALLEIKDANESAIGRSLIFDSTDAQLTSGGFTIENGVFLIPLNIGSGTSYGLSLRFHQPQRSETTFTARVSVYEVGYTGEYMPVGYVGLDVGGVTVPINLQGNTLGEVDSVKDVLEVDADGTVTLNKNDGSTIPLGSVTMPTVTDGTTIKALAENAPDVMAVYERYVVFKGEQPIKRIYKGQELIYPESE